MAIVSAAIRDLELPLAPAAARRFCETLEAGDVIDLGPTPIRFTNDELSFLRGQKKSEGAHHKNVAYRPHQDRLTGLDGPATAPMRALMRRFSQQAVAFLHDFLSPYQFDVDYASFRPLEEEGRPAKLHARNDLLHVDSFPTRPSRGRRILRFFVNVNPEEPRVWRTGPPFPELARALAAPSGLLARYRRDREQPALARALTHLLGRCGLATQFRPPYDRFMLSFHDWLKANDEFQSQRHTLSSFAPMSSWLCMTDTVSHAVVRGRLALEQTILVHPGTLQAPALAPQQVLDLLALRGSAAPPSLPNS